MAETPLKTRPTIKDVARVAGVHFTTVSLALRDHPSIPESTRLRIREAAAQVGYSREAVFSALTHFRQNGRVRANPPCLGYLANHHLERGVFKYRHQSAVFEGAKKQAALLGYDLELLIVGEGHYDSRSLEKHLAARNITGIILASFEPGFASVNLAWDHYAVVKINSTHMAPEATRVANDQLYDVRLAFHHLAALGYKRIGLAVGRADEESTNFRHSAGYFVEQFALPPGDRVPTLLFPHNTDARDVSEMIGRWIRAHRIDAVMCNWFIVDQLVEQAGFRVPDEVACVCLCLLEDDDRMAGVCPNLQLVGTKAVSLLTSRLKSSEFGAPEFASTTYVRSFWRPGASAPARN